MIGARTDPVSDEPRVLALSRRQLDAYNRADLEAFCECYHREVCVLDAAGERTLDHFKALLTKAGLKLESVTPLRGYYSVLVARRAT